MKSIWEADERVLKRAIDQYSKYERESRYLKKRSEEYSVIEEVFDKPTLLTLYELMNAHVLRYLNGVVRAGKESRVYWGVCDDGLTVAVKIFLVTAAVFRRRMQYIDGDPRFARVRRGMANLVNLWARKEFRNLSEAYNAGVPVPKPYHVQRNVLVMEFIGNDGVPAPLISETEVSAKDYTGALKMVHILYRKAHLVHADLSEFNIFKTDNRLVVFDMGSAVDVSHPMAHEFLKRDLENLNRFFSKRAVDTIDSNVLFKRVVGA